ncbi:MAG TPA: hypothetical protein VEO95_01375 [Chthoniobacteraceae bacterium]|nr:hypothetical protein [Chthoniobacteraceae bacterium]
MKTPAIFFAAIAVALALGGAAHSQNSILPQTPVQKLEAVKAKNKQLLDKQAETLKKLEEMELQSQQIKFLGKRT